MKLTSRKTVIAAVATLGASAVLLSGCGSAPTTAASKTASSYLPCVVGDTGGFNDHSFNEQALDGVMAAATKIGGSYKKVQAKSSDDYASEINSLISEKCNIIVAPGFQFPASVKAAATANPSVDFAQIDDNSITLPNVKDIVFETDEAAFLGGYIAASYSKTGVVATWGGADYPSVTIYMDGIADGVAYYNQQKSKSVKLLGWDVPSQKGTFVGNFTDQNAAKSITQNFLDQKADVIIPVAGGLVSGAGAAITSSGSTAVLEGVDSDLYNTVPDYKSLFLVSILKQVQNATTSVIEQAAAEKTFDSTTYVGTLKNGGVGVSPFHDYASKVDSGLAAEVKKIEAGIIDGTIKVTSPSSFNK